MPLNVKEMVSRVRGNLLEFDENPISNTNIVERLNQAYAVGYAHLVRSNDDWFSKSTYVDIRAGVHEYDIPKEVYSRRIEQMEVPVAPNAPIIYTKLEKVPYKHLSRYILLRVRTLIQSVWCQNGEKFYVAPVPQISYRARMIYTPNMTPLSYPIGQIVNISGNEFTVDELYSDVIQSLLTNQYSAFIGVCDWRTGNLKQVFQLTGVSGNVITVGPRSKDTYKGFTVTPIQSEDVVSVKYLGTTVTMNLANDVASRFVVGDKLEVKQNITTDKSYCTNDYRQQFETEILATINSGDDNNPPDYIVSSNSSPFDTVVTVSAVTPTSISFEAAWSPYFTEGYKTPAPLLADRSYKTVEILDSALTSVTLSGSDFGSLSAVTVTLVGSGLPNKQVVVSTQVTPTLDNRILLTSSALFKAYNSTTDVQPVSQTNTAGKTYTHVTYLATTIPISAIVTNGYGATIAFSTPHNYGTSGTVRVDLDDTLTGYGTDILRYREATILNSNMLYLPFKIGAKYNQCKPSDFLGNVTGIPQLVTYDTNFNIVYPFSIYKWTPNSTTVLTTKTEAFDPAIQVEDWDYIVAGVTTAISELGENYDDFLCQYATYYVRSSLNEQDQEAREALSKLLDGLQSDSAGRTIGMKVERNNAKSYRTTSRFRGR
jgi:hypothetical protein